MTERTLATLFVEIATDPRGFECEWEKVERRMRQRPLATLFVEIAADARRFDREWGKIERRFMRNGGRLKALGRRVGRARGEQ